MQLLLLSHFMLCPLSPLPTMLMPHWLPPALGACCLMPTLGPLNRFLLHRMFALTPLNTSGLAEISPLQRSLLLLQLSSHPLPPHLPYLFPSSNLPYLARTHHRGIIFVWFLHRTASTSRTRASSLTVPQVPAVLSTMPSI